MLLIDVDRYDRLQEWYTLLHMHKGPESFEERLDKNALEQQDRYVLEVLRELDPGVDGAFDSYVTINFTDGTGRFAEIRMMRDQDDPAAYQLNANVGSPLVMLELFERLRSEGIRISRMAAYMGSAEEKKVLRQAVEEANGG